jgi:hypothetical protein
MTYPTSHQIHLASEDENVALEIVTNARLCLQPAKRASPWFVFKNPEVIILTTSSLPVNRAVRIL